MKNNMTKIKTNKEISIELRNKISARIVEAGANLMYWNELFKKAPKNSQEIVDIRQNIEINETNIKKDTLFLKCIDLIIKKEK